jgi:hypothetical protein
VPPQKKRLNRNPNLKDMQYTVSQSSKWRFEKENKYKEKKLQLTGPDIKWSGAVCGSGIGGGRNKQRYNVAVLCVWEWN